jgi:hypothetical protein
MSAITTIQTINPAHNNIQPKESVRFFAGGVQQPPSVLFPSCDTLGPIISLSSGKTLNAQVNPSNLAILDAF